MTSGSRIKLWALFVLISTALLCCTEKENPDPTNHSQTSSNFSAVHIIQEKVSAVKEAERLGQRFAASDFDPTGISLPPGKPIEVNVKILEGNSQPKLLVGTYSRVNWSDKPTVYDLYEGDNTITDYTGGLLYLKYVTDDIPTGKAEVTFKGGYPVPIYKYGETTHEGFLQMLDTMVYQDVIFVSNRTMVVVRKQTALQYVNANKDDMLSILDSVSNIEDYISGLDGSSDLHKPNIHKILISETADEGIFMAATSFRTMFNPTASNRIMDPVVAATEAWGLWHELGHMHQVKNWTWSEVSEVTVNIYSLAAKRGLESKKIWLEGDETWDILIEYFNLPLEKRDYNVSEMLTAKGRLAMFHQLWMAYGDEFYIKLHKLSREEKISAQNREEKMFFFMLLASKSCGYNLKDFFIEWGFKLPQADFDSLDALGLPDPTIDLLRLRE